MTYLPVNTSLIASGGNGMNRTSDAAVRVWDISTSICKKLIHLPSSSASVSCLASPWPGTDTIIAGTTSGAIHVMDMRISGKSNIVRTFSEHQSHVVNVALSKTGSCYAVTSASFASDVRFWDLRIERSLRSILAQERGKLTCLVAHDFAPLLLTGCLKHGATVLTNAGDEISRIERHDSFNSEPLGPVSSVAWHPTRLEMAIASSDNRISLRLGGDGS
jgi:regulator-associated protein of mTOR